MASSARIDELRKKFDENPRRYFAPLANEYRKAGDQEQAIFICQEYLPQQPGHMSGHIVYGQALYELSRFDEARAVFETALSLDPENLIALRHLGDIARQAGDLRGARSWYQRVLEADPRNEEIAQIMLTVLTTPHESQPAVPAAAEVTSDGIEGLQIGFGHNAPQGAHSAEFPVEKSEDGSGLAVGPELSQLAERQPEPEPIRRSREAIPDEELLDLNDFSVGDVPLSSLVVVAVEPPPTEPFVETGPAFESVSHAPESEPVSAHEVAAQDMDIERSGDAPAFEADPFAIAAASDTPAENDEPPPLPPEAFATDIALGLPDDGTTPSLSEPHDSQAIEGLESYSEPGFGVGDQVTEEMEVESFFSAPAESALTSQDFETSSADLPAASGTPAWTPSIELPAETHMEFVAVSIAEPVGDIEPPIEVPSAGEPVEEEPEAFVTETMAELYLQQGHLEAALDIYQRLAEQRPGDEYLRERMLAVADAIHDASTETTQPATSSAYDSYDSYGAYGSDDDDMDAAALDGTEGDVALVGPTIREFLAGVLQPRSFASAPEIAERAPTPASTAVFDDPTFDDAAIDAPEFDVPPLAQSTASAFDDSVFDTSAYGDAPSLSEPASYDTPAFGETPAYGSTPAFGGTPAFAATPTYGLEAISDVPQPHAESLDPVLPVDIPSFEESPYDARTLEIDLSATEFQSQDAYDSAAVAPTDSLDSIDEEFGAENPPSESVEPVVAGLPEMSEIPPVASSRPTPPSSSETVTGSIDALFSGADASTVDATAASTLAQAFASEVPEAPPLQGMPAHRATDELSLDHVFKSNPAPKQEAEGEGFSFDQFFADDIEAAPKPGAEPASSAAQGTDDIAQFNNWLNGLKKT